MSLLFPVFTSALTAMPVREITIFKDGHAFVMHRGSMPVNDDGNVVLDYLPAPVLGTFWPYSAEKTVKISAVTAGQRRVLVEATALALRDLIESNIGAEVVVTESPVGPPNTYPATILDVPKRSAEELKAILPPGSPEPLPLKGTIVLLKTVEGVKAVPIDRIQQITFQKQPNPKAVSEEFRNILTLKLEWPDRKPAKTADVGLFYLQRGVRWIPSYRVTIDGKGSAHVELHATLINELTDLNDVTANLVIGVPTFAFQDNPDPIGFQQTVARLSQYFRRDTDNYLSNAMMTQAPAAAEYNERRYMEGRASVTPALDLGPEIASSGRSEDLFVFTVKHLTLKKGERIVIPVTDFTLPYKDVYTLDLPFAPPMEVRRNFGSEQQRQIAQLLASSKVMHQLRLTNKSDYPLTTAPALILRDNSILAQGLLTYTPVGDNVDLPITNAVDVRVKKSDRETSRTPNVANWNGHNYGRVDLTGTISLTNYRKEAVDLEITRHVLGNVVSADHDGKVEMVNIFEDDSYLSGAGPARWWPWYNWPWWWYHFNGIGRVSWKVTLDPGKSVDLGYTWNYYWE